MTVPHQNRIRPVYHLDLLLLKFFNSKQILTLIIFYGVATWQNVKEILTQHADLSTHCP
jgi:hypothetical protein